MKINIVASIKNSKYENVIKFVEKYNVKKFFVQNYTLRNLNSVQQYNHIHI